MVVDNPCTRLETSIRSALNDIQRVEKEIEENKKILKTRPQQVDKPLMKKHMKVLKQFKSERKLQIMSAKKQMKRMACPQLEKIERQETRTKKERVPSLIPESLREAYKRRKKI